MSSVILSTATRLMLPLLLLFSVFLLLRGHNAPGGGFIGGLMAAGSFILHGQAFGVAETRRVLAVDPRTLLGMGLLMALGSGLPSLLLGQPFMTSQHLWATFHLPAVGEIELGPPLLFDVGVYLVVIGMTLTTILALAEE